jgi:hypothetical protein
LIFGIELDLPAAILLKGLQSLQVIILNEVLMENADQTLLLLRGGVDGKIGGDDLLRIDWGELGR